MSAFVRSGRVWVVGAVVVALVLCAGAWAAVIGPARSDAASVRSQVDDATLAQQTLRHRLRDLQTAAQNIGALQGAAAAAAATVPVTADTQGFLRQLQALADSAGVTVVSVSVSEAEPATVTGVWALPVSIVLAGDPGALRTALAGLQTGTGRAVTIAAATVNAAAAGSDAAATAPTLTVDATMYCSSDPTGGAAAAGGAGAGATAPAPAAAASSSGGDAVAS